MRRENELELFVKELKLKYGPVPVVCLCGSTRYLATYLDIQRRLTLAGVAVLTIGCVLGGKDGADSHLGAVVDAVHLRKIDVSDAVLVIDPRDDEGNPGHVGFSTRRELDYAVGCGVYRLSQIWPEYRQVTVKRALLDTYLTRPEFE